MFFFLSQVLPTVAQAFLELLPPRGIRWTRLPLEQLDPAPVCGAGDHVAADPLRTVLPATQRAFFEEIMQHAKVRKTRHVDACRLVWEQDRPAPRARHDLICFPRCFCMLLSFVTQL